MGKVVVSEYVTLDGVMEDPGGAEKGKYGGWSHKFFNDEAGKFKLDELFASDAMLLGRATYEGFASVWPTIKDEYGFADRMNGLPKYVVSKTLTEAAWNNTTVIKENIVEEVGKLRARPGKDILVAGSAMLVNLLLRHDLIDEYRFMVHPVVLGGGKRLFPEGAPAATLKFISSVSFAAGIVILTYQPDRKTNGD